MVRGRKKTPTAILEAKGAFRKDPQRRNKAEPQPTKGRPVMPRRLASDKVATAAWNDLCDQLAGMDLLTVADVFVIEKLAMLESFIDLAWNEKEISTFNRLLTTWKGLLIECGLTPSARARTKAVAKEEEDSTLAELVSLMTGKP